MLSTLPVCSIFLGANSSYSSNIEYFGIKTKMLQQLYKNPFLTVASIMYVCIVTHTTRVWINRVRLSVVHMVS